jgi:hypothetical protein
MIFTRVQITISPATKTCGFAACYAERLRPSVVEVTHEPPPRRRKALPSGGGEKEKKGRSGPERRSLSAQQGAEPHQQPRALAILDTNEGYCPPSENFVDFDGALAESPAGY